MKRVRQRREPRCGAALIALLAVMAVSVALAGVWTRRILDQRRWTVRRHQRVQVAWLAEAGLQRAAARRAANPDYDGETWIVEADAWDLPLAGEALLHFETDSDSTGDSAPTPRITAIARYPRGPATQVQVTKTFPLTPASR